MKPRWIFTSVVLLIVVVLIWTRLERPVASRDRGAQAAPAETAPKAEVVPVLEPAVHTEERALVEAPPAAAPESAAGIPAPLSAKECEIRGRFVLPGGAPAANVPFEVDGWESNDETVKKYGRPDHWEDLKGASDADGHVSVRFEPPRAYQFTLEAKTPGYAGLEWRWGEILAGSVVDLGEVELTKGGTVEGHLVDADGKPVLGGDWLVYAESVGLGESDGRDETQVTADVDPATGSYRAEDVMPGRVELSAYGMNWTPSSVIQVKSGETVEADIQTATREDSSRITIEAASRLLRTVSPEPEHVSVIGPDGVRRTPKSTRFSFGSFVFDDLPSGEYALSIEDARFRPWSGTARPGAQVEVELEGTSALEVVVHGAEGAPLDSCALSVEVRNVNFSPHGFEVPSATVSGARGIVAGLTSGDYRITARAGEQLGAVDVDGLAPGETRKVEIIVGAESVVSGRVRYSDGEPASEVAITLLPAVPPDAQRSELIASMSVANRVVFGRDVEKGQTDASGAFRFVLVRSGRYIVHAATSNGSEVVSETLELGPGKGREGLELVLPRGGHLAGRILAPPGTSCAGLRVWVGSPDRAIGETARELGADGRFAIGPIPPGPQSVYLLLPEQRQRMSHGFSMNGSLTNDIELGTVEVVDGGRVERDFEVPAAKFPGTVVLNVRVNGEIVAGVSLELSMPSGPRQFQVLGETDAHGRFGPALALPGSWTLQARDPDVGWCYNHSLPLLVSAARESDAEIEIQVAEASLVFLDAVSGAPLAGQFVSVLAPKTDEPFDFPLVRRKTDAQGRASFTLASGDYRLRLDENEDEEFPFFPDEPGAESAKKVERSVPVVWTLEGPLTREFRL